jgi:arginine/lysine/ornithine decarboxylase
MAVALKELIAPSPLALTPLHPIDTLTDHRHDRAPVLDALRAYTAAGTIPFSSPGHKLGAGADPALRDLLGERVFAADVWLNTAVHDATIGAAEQLAAAAWGAENAFFLVNGSSSGNYALLLATLGPGDEVVIGRDVHTSLLTALVLTGARPVWVAPKLHPDLDVGLGLDPADIAATLDAHPAAKLVALVSPTYWGVSSDLPAIVAVAHARGVPVYVDEAWGPHFPFHPALPPSAMASGADAAVTSPHKLLAGLSQAALLTIQGPRFDPARVATTVRMGQTTSPLLPILASLDATRQQMARNGTDLLDRTLHLAAIARRRLRALPGLDLLDAAALGLPASRHDPTRLVIDVHRLGLTGMAAEQILRTRFAIAPEMSDLRGVVCLITIGDTPASIARLVAAFTALALEDRGPILHPTDAPRSAGEVMLPGEQALTPREAFFADSRAVPLASAIGEAAAELVVPYPPGVPLLAPGEVISAAKVEYLHEVVARGGFVRGAADPTVATVRIVAPCPAPRIAELPLATFRNRLEMTA